MKDPVEQFYDAVKKRAENNMQLGDLIVGAYAKALDFEIVKYRREKVTAMKGARKVKATA